MFCLGSESRVCYSLVGRLCLYHFYRIHALALSFSISVRVCVLNTLSVFSRIASMRACDYIGKCVRASVIDNAITRFFSFSAIIYIYFF